MPPLPTTERRQLENAVVAARKAADSAARIALKTLAVEQEAPFPTMDEPARRLRRALRARARQLGGGSFSDGIPLLVDEIAYEQWHRMLFARFLAENRLLRHPSGATVSIDDCQQLAEEEGEPGVDGWELAARYAGAMLPGLFRADDPAVQIRFAPEGRAALEAILNPLPAATFQADDALGWVYQFWQKEKKDEVNKSGRKIGGADLAPVTQLFTEDYMVRFLLENSLGAWWAARHPESPLVKDWIYLRFNDDGTPAAGSFSGWPVRAAEVTVMDPCCGSGHFLVAAFGMLRQMRTEEEGLSAAEAADAVLSDNLFGLELDPRCTQIAAFAVAMTAWKVGGNPELFPPKVACSGVSVGGDVEAWRKLGGRDDSLRYALGELYDLFRQAQTLGSLIDPKRVLEQSRPLQPGFRIADWTKVEAALCRLVPEDVEAAVFAQAAEDSARAASLLGQSYTLVATNVPYLSRGSQDDMLKKYASTFHDDARADLATIFVSRCLGYCDVDGAVAIVTPQNWLFLGTYKHLRRRLLETATWKVVSRLGAGAFETISGEVVNVALCLIGNSNPSLQHTIFGIDAREGKSPGQKDQLLQKSPLKMVTQQDQLENPDARVMLAAMESKVLLDRYASAFKGHETGDIPHFGRTFWELPALMKGWEFQQSTVVESTPYGGCSNIVFWEDGRGELAAYYVELAAKRYATAAWKRGGSAWGKRGVAVSMMSQLACSLYTGELFDSNTAVILPKDPGHLAAIWVFCSSPEFNTAVRKIDQKMNVTNATLVKVPFDLQHWRGIAEEQYPNGLPEPHSHDPAQWFFKGHPAGSTAPLQVAVARLVGYRWPQQTEDDLERFSDEDGIVCLPPAGGEQPAADRLRALLAAAYGAEWSQALLDRLLAEAGSPRKDLAAWLRDDVFAQHCTLFHNRPFVWHVWDGRKDGFSALVNYHKLDAGRLEKLIYTYLGGWIRDRKAEMDAGEAGAEARYLSAVELQNKLKAIREGEPPHDVYVRWKPLHEQPIGWEPDLNDGVRLNVRPWVGEPPFKGGVLRCKFTVNWNKDRGTNPDGSERINDRHLTNAEKRRARAEAATRSA